MVTLEARGAKYGLTHTLSLQETSIDSHLSTSQNNEVLQNSHNQQDEEEEEEVTSFNDDLISQVFYYKHTHDNTYIYTILGRQLF